MYTFFLPAAEWREPYLITGTEARHLAGVLRVKPGETVCLLDGQGREGIFVVTEVAKREVHLQPREITSHPRPTGRPTLAIGYGRNLRRGWLLEKAVELETAALWFWQADRSQGKVPPENKETWLAQMTAGAKQCKNPWLPELATLPGGVEDIIAAGKKFSRTLVLWEGDTLGRMLSLQDLVPAEDTLFVLGPEGGFSPREITRLQEAAFSSVSLGDRVLRWETAAMLCLGITWWARQQEIRP